MTIEISIITLWQTNDNRDQYYNIVTNKWEEISNIILWQTNDNRDQYYNIETNKSQ